MNSASVGALASRRAPVVGEVKAEPTPEEPKPSPAVAPEQQPSPQEAPRLALPVSAPSTAPATRARILPPEEWATRLPEVLAKLNMPMPVPGSAQVVVLEREDTDELVGYWFLFIALHVEPLWLAPEFRNRIGVIRRMWNTMRDLLLSIGAKQAYGIIGDEGVVQQARRIGFQKAPGSLYFIDVKAEGEADGKP